MLSGERGLSDFDFTASEWKIRFLIGLNFAVPKYMGKNFNDLYCEMFTVEYMSGTSNNRPEYNLVLIRNWQPRLPEKIPSQIR